MKKLVTIFLFLIIYTIPVLANEEYTFEISPNKKYVLILDKKIKEFSFNSTAQLKIEMVTDILNSKSKCIISAKKNGKAKLHLTSLNNKKIIYNILVNDKNIKKNYDKNFYELDLPIQTGENN